ncbi:uncharacterized protein VDAG_02373 [Verticillium dahliae VdLs.17]|uniref:Uncharacterized protein n=1 Tax=Verticillium dahliae (strain VdLs.17 / ATCC MYA-4575 / FGSC 10137) TaxID=498257 RepID=G2WXP1_VERDV|nr:uncharacterized protein VDAG_02373 [Verticillium dahliae VdLs.17]EGY20849.1 hypothetical protein VDAG_02373 [Verticillium dahliae VdLs.17]
MFEEAQQHITAAEVNEASDLKRIGQQRLRDISATVPTYFTFNVPLSSPEYDASITIEVKPFVRENSPHPLYDILIHCEATSSGDQVDELGKKVQEVYDTYIQAVRWKFDRHCFEANPSRRRCTECPSLAPEGKHRTYAVLLAYAIARTYSSINKWETRPTLRCSWGSETRKTIEGKADGRRSQPRPNLYYF